MAASIKAQINADTVSKGITGETSTNSLAYATKQYLRSLGGSLTYLMVLASLFKI
jgi:hypothetical protein